MGSGPGDGVMSELGCNGPYHWTWVCGVADLVYEVVVCSRGW